MAESRPKLRHSPLAHRAPVEGAAGAIRIAERRFLGKFILRAEPNAAVEKVRVALGLGLPFDPLTSAAAGETAFLWMGPDEWMLVTAAHEAAAQLQKAADALAATHHQLVDVSDYYTTIEVAGMQSRELLMKLTTLDLHPRAFRAGLVSGCVLGRANATVWLTNDAAEGGPAFRIFIRWSMADYLWCLLADAGREWGVPRQVPVKGECLYTTVT